MAAIRNSVLAESTEVFEATELRLQHWGEQARKRSAQQAAFSATIDRPERGSTTSRVQEFGIVFKGGRRLSRRERIKLEREQAAARAQREAIRKAELKARRGRGPVKKCDYCMRIYRGDGECMRCKNDPALYTARGKQSRGGPRREAPMPYFTIDADAALIDSIVAGDVPGWAKNALNRFYRFQESNEKSADDLMISAGHFAARVRAAVWHVARALADRGKLEI